LERRRLALSWRALYWRALYWRALYWRALSWRALSWRARLWHERQWLAGAFAVFAVYAGVVTAVAGGADATWGIWATAGYAAAAILLWRSRGWVLPLLAALGCSLTAPMLWLAVRSPATADVSVVAKSAILLLHHGSPYLSANQLVSWKSYNPYLPAMAIFGLPHAVGLPGVLGDPRLWLAVTCAALLATAFSIASPHGARRCPACRRTILRNAALVMASPMFALPLAVGITDPPIIALVCLALACVGRHVAGRNADGGRFLIATPWLVLAGLGIGAACAMKATAWPAVAVIAAMLAFRAGRRAAVRFAAAAVSTAAVLVMAAAPALLLKPGAFFQNTVLFPLGLTRQLTPATSPLPGHLLASTGSAGHLAAIILLVAVGLAFATSLVLRPARNVSAATLRLALGLTLMFALAPATRFGYFAYPAALLGWLALNGYSRGTVIHYGLERSRCSLPFIDFGLVNPDWSRRLKARAVA
jgi:hypothetical protein